MGQTKSPSPRQPAIPRADAAGPPNIQRDPSEVHPWPTSPGVHWRPDEDITEEHRPPADIRPQPGKHQDGRKPARGRIGLRPR